MSTDRTPVSPSTVTTVAAWRHLRIGWDGTTKPVR
jgi:hypothetical protein